MLKKYHWREQSAVIGALLILALPLATAQTNHHGASQILSHQELKSQGILRANIDFKPDNTIPGISLSPIMEYPIKCSENGTAFLDMFVPPDFRQQKIYAVSSSQVHQFNPQSITDLQNIFVRSYFPLDSGLLLLVNAALNNSPSTKNTEKHDYIAKFSEDGSYSGLVKLDPAMAISQIAAFPSGNFLAFGIREFDKTIQLALLTSDGSILRYLELPPKVNSWAKNQMSSIPGLTSSGAGMLPSAQMFPIQGNILLVPSQSDGLVLEISEGGAIRPVTLQLPTGNVILAFVPSADHWYVRTSSSLQKPNVSTDTDKTKMALYEVNQQDGKIIREIEPKNATYEEIGCATGQEFSAFHRDDKGKMVGLRATLQ